MEDSILLLAYGCASRQRPDKENGGTYHKLECNNQEHSNSLTCINSDYLVLEIWSDNSAYKRRNISDN